MKRIWIFALALWLCVPCMADQADLDRFKAVVQYLQETSKSRPSQESLLSAAQSALPTASADLQESLSAANDNGELQKKVILAVLQTLNDPWAKLYAPDEVADLRSRLSGDGKAALGLTVIKDENPTCYRVVGVCPEGPADGKLVTGDAILWANGESADSSQFANAIRGGAGKVVDMQVLGEDGVTRNETVTLADFDSKTAFVVDQVRGIIRITSFGPDTAAELRYAMEQLDGEPAIIDLRFNGGGYVSAAVDSSDLFLERGETIVTTVSPNKVETHTSEHDAMFRQPVCLLVNSRTASAAEIFTAALRQNAGAYVVGDKTYGKGSVQRLVGLPGNWAVKYTTSLYKTPTGVFIDKIGLEPDCNIEMEPAMASSHFDTQLAEAVTWSKEKSSLAQKQLAPQPVGH